MADDGQLVLVFDDGYTEDYEEVWPVLRSAGVPGCFAIVSDWIGEPESLNSAQLTELTDEGCEVVAHGRRHRFLQAHRLSQNVVPGDDRIYLDSDHVFPDQDSGVLLGDRYEVTDGTTSDIIELTDKGETNDEPYLECEGFLDESYAAGETIVRPSEEVLHDEIVGANEDFRDLGFDTQTFVLPYGAGDVRAWSVVEQHYDVLANAAVRSLPNPPGTPFTNLRRYYLETTHLTDIEIEEYLNAVSKRSALGILAGHSAWDSVPAERVSRVINMARERGIEVTTFRDVLTRRH